MAFNSEKALQERIAELEAKLAARNRISFKVSEKGALSVYGLGRFPVTLYRGQWERLIGEVDNIIKFIDANKKNLTTKD